ncbi:hypothetical protein R3P38DRAFT_2783115 [Favolaschia claudopus]|uniref:Uncharacterized protein n=1 Tax=Favolaschia claudopus TaxID=2862362 RepID=A0AAW0B219_9AGAR
MILPRQCDLEQIPEHLGPIPICRNLQPSNSLRRFEFDCVRKVTELLMHISAVKLLSIYPFNEPHSIQVALQRLTSALSRGSPIDLNNGYRVSTVEIELVLYGARSGQGLAVTHLAPEKGLCIGWVSGFVQVLSEMHTSAV